MHKWERYELSYSPLILNGDFVLCEWNGWIYVEEDTINLLNLQDI